MVEEKPSSPNGITPPHPALALVGCQGSQILALGRKQAHI